MADAVTISIRDLAVFGRHGVFAAERELGQTFMIDLDLRLMMCAAVETDDLRDTADYATLTADVAAIVAGPPHALLERLAGAIADRALREPLARSVDVRVRKPHVALPHPVDHTAVRLRRARRHRYWLGLGGNLGDVPTAIGALLDVLRVHGVEVEALSPAYRSAPREITDQPPFINAAARVRTPLTPPRLLRLLKRAERRAGRTPGPRFGPRAVDCDILLWDGGAWDDHALCVPHPRLAQRRFAMLPLLDLDAGLRLPDGRALAALCAAIEPQDQPVTRLEGVVL